MKRWAFGAFCALAASAAQGASVFSEWNLIVRNNVVSSSEVDGSALIGGNLTGTSNYAVQGVTALNGDGLAVGGNLISGNIQVNNGGNVRLGGSNFATLNLNGGGALIADGTVVNTANNAISFAQGVSTQLASLTSNGTLDGAGNLNAVPTLIDGQLVAVYNLTSAALQSLGQLNLNIGGANSVILNVAADGNGVVDLIAPPNIIGDFNQSNSNRILWNFYDATSVIVNNSFNGALLAPGADLQVLGGGINGTVIVDNISNQQAEIRLKTYDGYIPEPASGLLLLAGLAALARNARTRG